jgi:hypothetical protein
METIIRDFLVYKTFRPNLDLKNDAGFPGFVLPKETLDCLRHATDKQAMYMVLAQLQRIILSEVSRTVASTPTLKKSEEPIMRMIKCKACDKEKTCDEFSNTQKNVGREKCKSCI